MAAASEIALTESQEGARPAPVEQFLQLTKALGELIERETDLLEQRRFQDADALAAEKARLTNQYQATLQTLRAREKSLLGEPDSPLRRELKEASEAFRSRLARHARLVMRLKSLNEGLVKAISEEAEKQRNPVTPYGGDGSVGRGKREPTSLSLDQCI